MEYIYDCRVGDSGILLLGDDIPLTYRRLEHFGKFLYLDLYMFLEKNI